MLTLDEAIRHCKEVAIEYEAKGECYECGKEHRQLAEWLEDYKRLKEATRWIPCSEMLPKHSGDVLIFVDDCIYMADLSTDKKEFAVGSYEMWWNVEEVSHWMPLPEMPKGDAE